MASRSSAAVQFVARGRERGPHRLSIGHQPRLRGQSCSCSLSDSLPEFGANPYVRRTPWTRQRDRQDIAAAPSSRSDPSTPPAPRAPAPTSRRPHTAFETSSCSPRGMVHAVFPATRRPPLESRRTAPTASDCRAIEADHCSKSGKKGEIKRTAILIARARTRPHAREKRSTGHWPA